MAFLSAVILVWEFPSYTFEETFTKTVTIVKAQDTSTELELTFVIQAVQPNVENFATFRAFTDDAAFGMCIRICCISINLQKKNKPP